jgi:monovalent cation:H+ antiporter-2, CPA2 family
MVRRSGIDALAAWRTGLLLAVGGEFGFACWPSPSGCRRGHRRRLGQIALASVLFSMIAGPFLIRFNHGLALRLAPRAAPGADSTAADTSGSERDPTPAAWDGHVLLAGYGRVGQSLGHLLEAEGLPWVAVDLDAARVREARLAGMPVFFGDSTQVELLESLGLGSARLMVITHDDTAAALRMLQQVRLHHTALPLMVRTRDLSAVQALREAGATEVFPETLEAGLMIASQALLTLGVPLARVLRQVRDQRASHYRQLRELFPGDALHDSSDDSAEADHLHAIRLPAGGTYIGQALAQLPLQGLVVTALVRQGHRQLQPAGETLIKAGDTLVLFGPRSALSRAEHRLLAPE